MQRRNETNVERCEVCLPDSTAARNPRGTARRKLASKSRRAIPKICRRIKSTVRSGFRIIFNRYLTFGTPVCAWRASSNCKSSVKLQNEINGAIETRRRQHDHEDSESAQDAFGTVFPSGYGGGKWGKYLRAPDLYFQIMRRYGDRFIQFGEIATIRFGVKSGCDAFFMPRDVSTRFLEEYPATSDWRDAPIYSHCKRTEVETGNVKLIMAGNGTVHPVESKYLAPEVHSLMEVDGPIIDVGSLKHLILLVADKASDLHGTHVGKYLRYGERTSFASDKSRAVPVPKRSTCAARDPWYDLTYTKRGHLVWPKSQQYRHIVGFNSAGLIVNCNLYDVTVIDQTLRPPRVLAAVLNSTLVALFKIYFGRYAGTEGNLKTEVIDVNLLEIPDPRYATREIAAKLTSGFDRLCGRQTQPMVEEIFMDCRSSERAEKMKQSPISLPPELKMRDRRDLDLAVFELIGVTDAKERERLCDQLYFETAKHFRDIRIVEIKKQEQRTKSQGRGLRIDELALDVWDALTDDERLSIPKWIERNFAQDWLVTIPDGSPKLPDAEDMLDAATVFFSGTKGARATRLNCPTRAHAEVVYQLGKLGIRGDVSLPSPAEKLEADLSQRLLRIDRRVDELARSRSTDESRIQDLAGLLRHWMILGKPKNT